VATAFFDALRARCAGPVVCEPRHDSWTAPDALALLAAHRVGLVKIEIPAPERERGHNDVPLYIRLHGSPRRYYSAYSDAQLAQLAEFLRLNPKRQRFVVFDNTASNAGVRNALHLRQLVAPD
jgi:uncharacterized protein YecE (DUF72 family)